MSFLSGGCFSVVSLLLLVCATAAHSATINAVSPSRVDVGNAVAAAANGDTVVIPAGTATWTTGLTLNKAITLQGAGIGQTIIRDAIAAGYVINTTLVADQVTRITGIEFNDAGATRDWRFRFSGTSIDGRRVRVDHCKFDSLSGPVFLFYTTLGVIDHNIIIGRSSGVPAFMGHVLCPSWAYPADVPRWGDGAFVEADLFGTEKFLFFENNNITNLYTASALTMLDGQGGSRYVFRNNNVVKGSMEIHGAEAARSRSGRAYEIYGNTFVSDNTRPSPVYMRGGVGLVYSNRFSGWTASAVFSLLDNRLNDHLFAPIWGADGRNPWDKNNPGNPFASATVTSASANTVTDSTKNWVPNQWAGYTIRRTSGKTVTSLTRVGSLATVVCPGHGFTTGNQVSFWGANQQPFNGLFTVTVLTADTFTFTINLPPAELAATGAIRCARGNSFSLIIANTANQLTFGGSIYGSTANLSLAAGDTFEINKVDQTMDQIGVIGGADLKGTDVASVWANTQTVSPWYEWANTREGGADVNFSTGYGGGGNFSTIKANTHYFNNTVKPGYTAFTFPHPLVSGSPSTNRPANSFPTISGIASQVVTVGASVGVINFTVADAETAAANLTVSGNSSNPALVPNANLVFGGSGGSRTLTVTPVSGQTGSAIITVSVSDGESSASTSFEVTITATPANHSPTVSGIASQVITVGDSLGVINFTVADAETAAGSLTVNGSSSNPSLVPNANLVFGGSGGSRTLTVTPVSGQVGAATITVTVSDGSASANTSFEVTVIAPQVGQMVAAYSFDEGAGTQVSDLSGNTNHGTLSNATWTAAGKYGGGLAFNGAGRVTVLDSSSLDLTSGMTLSAWVNPAATTTDWSTIVMKAQPNNLVYALYSGTPGNVPNTQIVTAGKTTVDGSSGLPANAWSHLAATYDGATLRLYVNGSQVSSQPVSGSVLNSSGVLTLGGETIWGKYFRGTLDEVRIYNRALSTAEIQADMNRPLGTASTKPAAPSALRIVAAP